MEEDSEVVFKDGDMIKLVLCPCCGIVQGLHDNVIGTDFYCKFCKKTVKSLKFLRSLQLDEEGTRGLI